jgi:DNA gyrase subunit B
MAEKKRYSSASVKTLRFPDDVRASAGMYMGSTDSQGVWVAVREPLDNAVDEFLAGRGTMVHLYADPDGSYWIVDDAGGIPQGLQKHVQRINGKDVTIKTPTMQAIFADLHTSGKYHSEAYEVSRGTHGIGVKGTNATAEYFDVWSCYENEWYEIGFKRGVLTQEVKKSKAPKLWDGTKPKKGTIIHFRPDPKIFTAKSFAASLVTDWAELAAYLSPGFKVVVTSPKGSKEFYSTKGPIEYIEKQMATLKCEGEAKMFFYKSALADVIVAFTNHSAFAVKGFVNGLSQPQGGKHVDSVTGALYEALKPSIKVRKVKENGKAKEVPAFRESDLREGLVGLVNLYLHKATYSSQDKAKLTDDRAGAPFEAMLAEEARKFFDANKALATRLCERATKINELKTKFTLSKKAASKLSAMRRGGLPAKFASWDPRTKVQDRELFIVEGDSAGGTVKEARFPYQGVLPLKGKIMNALKKAEATLESVEILSILAAIGFDVNAADPYSKLQVGKIVCLADPDPDGPFVGETMIRFRHITMFGDQSSTATIADLSTLPEGFDVPVYNGQKEIWAPATARLERNVDTLVAIQIGDTKYKVSEDHKFLVHANTPAMRGRPSTESKFPGMVFVRAADMKIGDRVYKPEHDGSRKPNEADKLTRYGYAPVSKLRIQQLSEPVPVYCVTVPKHHTFLLPDGIVSSNCHINSLLLTLFYRFLPELFERNMVYVANSPEFYATPKIDNKLKLVTGDTLSQVSDSLKKIKAPANTAVRHVKGYGEINSKLMRIMVMDPATRRLIRIKALDAVDHTDFVRLMNDDVDYRREMLGLPKGAAEKTDEDGTASQAGDKQRVRAAGPKKVRTKDKLVAA